MIRNKWNIVHLGCLDVYCFSWCTTSFTGSKRDYAFLQLRQYFLHGQCTFLTWILCFQKTNYWKPFFCCCFSFFFVFTHHSISHETKTVIWMTQKYTLLSYYNNDFTPSKKNSCTTTFQTSSFLHQRWQTLIVQIPDLIHLSREKSFKLISCRLHSPGFLHSLFS